jgi:phosphatidate cytidylyltransferase
MLSYFYQDLSSWQWLIVGGIIVVTGTYGDLVESLFKRSIAIKDSGTKLPGHGGFLDRFDGLLISSHFIMLFLKIF